MAKRIEEIFEECLARIEHGESIESCLASYPEEAQELEMMLRTFVNVKWRTTLVEPNPRFKAWGRAQLFNIYRQKAYQDEQKAKQSGKSFLQRMLVPTIAGVVIFVLIGGVGTAAASSEAMPDQPLYPVKLATEEVRLALSFSDAEKAVVNTELAQRRAQEIAAMAELGKVEYIAPTADRMLNNLENAEQAVTKVILSESVDVPEPPPVQPPSTPPEKPAEKPTTAVTANVTDNQTQQEDISKYTGTDDNEKAQNQRVRESYEKTVAENLAVLEAALNTAPEDAKSTIQKAVDVTRTKKENIENTGRLRWLDRNRNGIPDKDEIKRPDGQSDNTTSTGENNLSGTENVATDNTTDSQSDMDTEDKDTGDTSNSNNSTAVSDNITSTSDNTTGTGKTGTEDGVNGTNKSTSSNVTTNSPVKSTTANITSATSNNSDAILIDESGTGSSGDDISFTNASATTDTEKTTRRSRFWPWRIFR